MLIAVNSAGLTDYEIRDLNDEINKLLREKSHFERQIIALGGANYRRARTNMIDDDGREVPGTRGYKYVCPLYSPKAHTKSPSSADISVVPRTCPE